MTEKDSQASMLAQKHFEVEEGMRAIFRVAAPDDAELQPTEPIKLLEVNDYTVPTGILPLYFGPAPRLGISYPLVIMEVTPNEFKDIQANRLPLPNGWRIREEIQRVPAVQPK